MSVVRSYPVKSAPKGIRWEVLYRTPENRATRKRGFRTKRDAEAWQTDMESDKQKGSYVSPSAGRITVDQVGAQWKTGRGHLKSSTIYNTESAWNRVSQRWGPTPVGNVTRSGIKSWITQLVADGVGVESIENAFSVLRQVMDTAVDDKRIAANPCLGVKLPHRRHTHLDCLTHERVAALAKAVDEHADSYGVVIRMLCYTGLRWNEFAALKVRCLDFDQQRIQVIEGVTEVKGELEWGTTKTHTQRSVPFPKLLTADLRARAAGKGRDDLVFTSPEGGVLRVSNFRRRVFTPALATCIAADPHFPEVTLRKLRNTAASLAIAEGADVKEVQAMMGHKSAAMTLDVYASLFPSGLDDVARRLHDAASPRTLSADLGRLIDHVTTAVENADAALATHSDLLSDTARRDLTTARTRLQSAAALLRTHAAATT